MCILCIPVFETTISISQYCRKQTFLSTHNRLKSIKYFIVFNLVLYNKDGRKY